MLTEMGTIIWNGPVGVFEFDQFGEGTKTLALAIAESAVSRLPGVEIPLLQWINMKSLNKCPIFQQGAARF